MLTNKKSLIKLCNKLQKLTYRKKTDFSSEFFYRIKTRKRRNSAFFKKHYFTIKKDVSPKRLRNRAIERIIATNYSKTSFRRWPTRRSSMLQQANNIDLLRW
ncbi:hypothetical protein BpHYR1_029891 [Brachionus plicatilis]|uniref:Uncharacterized protein n=1 Tax=Brachionus plicatilis TaxID=10195 RepID=A0A3M7RFV5_BRAPC|nr:hypothetical protein BpHYR1_029891 [Brachionus plicatilis]